VVLVLLVSPSIAQKVDVSLAIKEALKLLQKCPLSFLLSGDYTVDVQAQIKEVEALRQNEYFARRWWELQYLDYKWEIEMCLISIEDLCTG
jgi:hypothetical protein